MTDDSISTVRVSYIIATRDRPERLGQTLAALGALPAHDGEVIVVDNASSLRAVIPQVLANGLPVRLVRLASNVGAAARNAGAIASDPACAWLVMLDDDSHPVDLGFLAVLAHAPGDVLAISAEIDLPAQGRREAGGLPEVFIGCGVAIRREVFLELGGYDARFGYYAEEYDLAARLMLAGGRIAFEPRFRVAHHKVPAGRDMDLILARLVRNNGWVMQRYAPGDERRGQLREIRRRYRAIAQREGALTGFGHGLVQLRATITEQRRSPMDRALFDRFTGIAAARDALQHAHQCEAFSTAALVEPGKNAWCVVRALEELGVAMVESREAQVLVIATMSPGPMRDALERSTGAHRRVIAPWDRAGVGLVRPSTALSRAG